MEAKLCPSPSRKHARHHWVDTVFQSRTVQVKRVNWFQSDNRQLVQQVAQQVPKTRRGKTRADPDSPYDASRLPHSGVYPGRKQVELTAASWHLAHFCQCDRTLFCSAPTGNDPTYSPCPPQEHLRRKASPLTPMRHTSTLWAGLEAKPAFTIGLNSAGLTSLIARCHN